MRIIPFGNIVIIMDDNYKFLKCIGNQDFNIGLIINFLLSIGWFPEPDKPFSNIFEAGTAGLMSLFTIGILSMLIYHIVEFFYNMFSSIGKAVKNRYEGNYKKCQLFEEYKTEKDTSSEPKITNLN